MVGIGDLERRDRNGGVITYRVAVGVMLAIIGAFVMHSAGTLDQMQKDIQSYAVIQGQQNIRLDRDETDIQVNRESISHLNSRVTTVETQSEALHHR